ncbi:Gfo/Idh/MocA family protein [Cohnella herbarum]|uniref:Gfo/Idh/MocA family oxidoreductase n=1 Tax=Cohnella herbarum TaxID=2728023 RepID=A0A7Z2VQ41_9BACL|nr:Gfo/Idh/MocA family oxidoreductase [Cohnella herbarum]QJD86895.1 Gfo/Idh/MocA family oxidoreductase [Cohnella herbarum]
MIEAALLGAGGRGMFAYASYALKRPDEIKFVAVAEPNAEKRERFAREHAIPPERTFSGWEELLEQPRLCQALFICTQDADHYAPSMKALDVGYDIILEKPMATSPLESLAIAQKAERLGRLLTVCHTMRYSNYFNKLKELIDSGTIGRIMSVQWTENVGYWHQAHSFVRGNWRRADETSPMILAKSCHDMDILQHIVGGEVLRVSSFGSLSFFKPDNAPEGSTKRCTDGCKVEHECPFSAIKWYYNEKDEWPQSIVSLTPTLEARGKALREGPYGRCVFHCDNDVVDHQVVNLLFDNEVTVAFTMSAFSTDNTRSFKIMGTAGEIRGYEKRNELEVIRFSGERYAVNPETVEGGHGGADTKMMMDFVKQLESGESQGKSGGLVSARSHLIAFAAEESRLTGRTITMSEYVAGLR